MTKDEQKQFAKKIKKLTVNLKQETATREENFISSVMALLR